MLALLISLILFGLAWIVTFQVVRSYSDMRFDSYLYDGEGSVLDEISEDEIWKSDPNEFIDSNGDHVYYERAIIEKKLFKDLNPEVPPTSLRSFARLMTFF